MILQTQQHRLKHLVFSLSIVFLRLAQRTTYIMGYFSSLRDFYCRSAITNFTIQGLIRMIVNLTPVSLPILVFVSWVNPDSGISVPNFSRTPGLCSIIKKH